MWHEVIRRTPKRKVARSNRAGRARLSTVIVCELVSVGCKDGVTYIHTWAIVKWGSLPTAIPKTKIAATQLLLSGGFALSVIRIAAPVFLLPSYRSSLGSGCRCPSWGWFARGLLDRPL